MQPAYVPTHDHCRRLTTTERVVLPVFHKITLATGRATVTYVPADGARSLPLLVQPGNSYVAFTGPLSLEIEPVEQPTRLCGG